MVKEVERSVDPANEPVTVLSVRQDGRIDSTEDDASLERYITTARIYFEDVYDLTFFTTTWKTYWEAFETPLIVPRPPYASVTTLQYIDKDGATQTLTENTDFVVDSHGLKGLAQIKPAEDQSWPTDVETEGYNAVILTYVAGYASLAAIPEPMLQALRQTVIRMFGHPEGVAEKMLYEDGLLPATELIGMDRSPHVA